MFIISASCLPRVLECWYVVVGGQVGISPDGGGVGHGFTSACHWVVLLHDMGWRCYTILVRLNRIRRCCCVSLNSDSFPVVAGDDSHLDRSCDGPSCLRYFTRSTWSFYFSSVLFSFLFLSFPFVAFFCRSACSPCPLL